MGLSWFIDDDAPKQKQKVSTKAKKDDEALRTDDIQEMDERQHVLHRPAIYVGSVTEEEIPTYVYEDGRLVNRAVTQIPALCKIVDEIIDNSVDEAIRTRFQYGTKIEVTFKDGTITVEDNGRGLPIEKREDGKWTPEVIYTKLRAGSNFADDGRATMGMNGVGSSLTNIFSSTFSVDTANGKQRYRQTFRNSMSVIDKPKVDATKSNYTQVTFRPNYDYFNATDKVMVTLPLLIEKRLRNLAFAFPEIQFKFNGQRIVGANLKQFLSNIHEVFEFNETDDARIGVFFSETDFQQISFVNGLETKRGGTHIENVSWRIIEYLREFLKKKHKIEVKPADIRSKLFIMLSLRITNAQFDGQTKERLMNPISEFKDILDALVTEKFLKTITKNEEIIAPIVESYKLQQQVKENLELKKMSKTPKKVKVDKYFPATNDQRYLMLCEGDSAAGGLMAALGRNQFSYFALRGVPMNTHEAKVAKITDNEELKNVVQILNMDLTRDAQTDLSHDCVVFASDQDLDGIHIRGLLLGFFHRFSPSLIKTKRVCYLQTPVVIGRDSKGKLAKLFFSFAEYREYAQTEEAKKYRWDYKKGLGSYDVESNELQEIIKIVGIENMLMPFEWSETVPETMELWLGSRRADDRKEQIRGREFHIDGL